MATTALPACLSRLAGSVISLGPSITNDLQLLRLNPPLHVFFRTHLAWLCSLLVKLVVCNRSSCEPQTVRFSQRGSWSRVVQRLTLHYTCCSMSGWSNTAVGRASLSVYVSLAFMSIATTLLFESRVAAIAYVSALCRCD